MRISYSSSDVCSSDLAHLALGGPFGELYLADELGLDPSGVRRIGHLLGNRLCRGDQWHHQSVERCQHLAIEAAAGAADIAPCFELGRASCRERVCQYV